MEAAAGAALNTFVDAFARGDILPIAFVAVLAGELVETYPVWAAD